MQWRLGVFILSWSPDVFVAVLQFRDDFAAVLEFCSGFILLWFCNGFVAVFILLWFRDGFSAVLTIWSWLCNGSVVVSKCGGGFILWWFCDGFVRRSLKIHFFLVLLGP